MGGGNGAFFQKKIKLKAGELFLLSKYKVNNLTLEGWLPRWKKDLLKQRIYLD